MLRIAKMTGRFKLLRHKETIRNFVWRALQTGGREGILLLILFIAARLLSPHDFGIYSYVMAVAVLLVLFGNFGIAAATSRYVAEYNAVDKEKLKLILFNSALLIIVLSFLVIAIFALFGKMITKDYYTYILVALPLVFLSPMAALYDGVYRGLKKFKQLALISILTGAITAVSAYFLISSYGLMGALLAQNLLHLLFLVGLFLGHRELYFKIDRTLIKTVGSYSFFIGISSMAFYLYTKADMIILERFGYVTEIGYYQIIDQTFILLSFPAIILGQVIAPNIAALNARKEYAIILLKLKKYFLRIVPIGILIALLAYFLFPEVLNTFLKEYHTPEMILAFTILIFLLPLKIWGVFLTQSFIISTGYVKIIALVTLVSGILNVIFDIIFIRWVGFIGVFWVTLIIHGLNISIVSAYYYYKLRRI